MRRQSKGMPRDDYPKCLAASWLVKTIAISALLPWVVALPAATADAATYLPNCGNSYYGGRVAPRYWDSGCTGNREIIRARWSRWGRRAATAESSTAVNDCDPDCARGTVQVYPSRARAYRLRRCQTRGGQRRRFYTRVRLTVFIDGQSPYRNTLRLVCQ
jgi:hypothetical protein